jgi:hypothetical protein
MNDQLRSGLDRLDINLARRIDKICRRFEADWRAGRRPASGDYLGEVPHEGRSVLLEELEAVECELREAGKERPRPEFAPSTTVAEAAIIRCLEKDPGRRYARAAALAEDLRRYLDGKPITARPVGAPERAWRWARRKPALSGALGGMALLLVAIAAIANFSAGRLKVERDAVLKKTARGSRRPGRGSARCTRSATAAHLGGNEPGMTPGPAPAGRGPSSARDPGRALALDPSRLESRSCSFPVLRGATGQAG